MEKNKLTFEENLEKLEEIVKELENGNVPLDEAISKFNEGMILANDCNETLEKATLTVKKLLDKDGNLEDFKIEE